MLRVSNVLNKYFKQKKILRYFSLPHGEYVIEYKKDDEIIPEVDVNTVGTYTITYTITTDSSSSLLT